MRGSAPPPESPARWRPTPFFWALIALSVLAITLGLWQLQAGRQRLAMESQPAATGTARSVAPDFTLMTAEGGTLSLMDLRGQVVLLNFWATWCPPCKAEMPDLDALHREHGESRGFAVVGINLEEETSIVSSFAESWGISFPLLLDSDGRVANKLFVVRSLPASMIIDRDGFIRDAWMGQISREAMLARLERVW